jgi:hypothetical protein
LNPGVHGPIPTEYKNSTRKGGGEDREVAVSGSPKTRLQPPTKKSTHSPSIIETSQKLTVLTQIKLIPLTHKKVRGYKFLSKKSLEN